MAAVTERFRTDGLPYFSRFVVLTFGSTLLLSKDENPTGQKIQGFSLLGKVYEADSWRMMLQKVCQVLITMHGDKFVEEAVKLKGTKRYYITFNPDELREPGQISGTDLWLETNLSAQQTISIITKMLDTFGHDKSTFAVYRDS